MMYLSCSDTLFFYPSKEPLQMILELPLVESLTVEFKSDRKRLPDRELVEAVICLANAEGDSYG